MAGVFISYARQDQDFARRLYDALRAAGVTAWVDLEFIPQSTDYAAELRRAIEGVDALIFVLSPDSIQSRSSTGELNVALAFNKRIIPVVARAVSVNEAPPPLATLQWIDFASAERFDVAAGQVVAALGPGRARGRVGPATPAYRSAALSPRVIVMVVILALIVVAVVIERILAPLASDRRLYSLAPQILTQLIGQHPYAWFNVAAGSVALNLGLAWGVVALWRRGRAARGAGAAMPSGVLFISYTRSDSEFIDKLEKDLGELGFTIWVDRRQLKGGQIWDATIVDALNRCQLALVVLSPDALKSGWVKKEYSYAARRGKRWPPSSSTPALRYRERSHASSSSTSRRG